MTTDVTSNNGNGRVTGIEHDLEWIKAALARIEKRQEDDNKATVDRLSGLETWKASVNTWGRFGGILYAIAYGLGFWWLDRR